MSTAAINGSAHRRVSTRGALDEAELRRLNPGEDPDWDAKIAGLEGASFFHGTAWARILNETYGFQPRYFVYSAAGQLRGVLPLMEVNSWLTGTRGVSLPFTDECVPLGSAACIQALAEKAAAFAATQHWRYLEFRGGTGTLAAPPVVSYHGHTIDLRADAMLLLARCLKATRGAVRQAERLQVDISFSHDIAAIRDFYSLLCKTRRRHGVPPQPLRFFEKIHEHVLRPGRGVVVLARVDGRVVAGAVFLHFGRRAIYKFAASDSGYQQFRANNLVLWRAIEWHARAGFTSLDLGRTAHDNHGLRHFKLGWGAKEHRIDYARFICKSAAYVTAQDRSTKWLGHVVKHLPVFVARLMGAVAYKHAA